MSKNLLILNGSIHGYKGNSSEVINHIQKKYGEKINIIVSHLLNENYPTILEKLKSSDAIMVVTGTYWESWGSPFQKFLEDFTKHECSSLFMGKPVTAIVLSHSVGGKSVMSRILSNLNLFGCIIPPMGGVELSFVSQEARKYTKEPGLKNDIWCLDDIDGLISNSISLLKQKAKFQSWPVDDSDFEKTWIKTKS